MQALSLKALLVVKIGRLSWETGLKKVKAGCMWRWGALEVNFSGLLH
jgi:hypothetical protein